MRGVISIIVGLVLIVGGLSGRIVLKGTESGAAAAGLGAVVLAIGVFRVVRSNG